MAVTNLLVLSLKPVFHHVRVFGLQLLSLGIPWVIMELHTNLCFPDIALEEVDFDLIRRLRLIIDNFPSVSYFEHFYL